MHGSRLSRQRFVPPQLFAVDSCGLSFRNRHYSGTRMGNLKKNNNSYHFSSCFSSGQSGTVFKSPTRLATTHTHTRPPPNPFPSNPSIPISPIPNSLKVDFCNIRGLDSNIDPVHQHLEDKKPDVLFLTETQVSKHDVDRFQAPHYFLEESFVLKHGVCAFISEHTSYQRMSMFEIDHKQYQTVILKVTVTNKSIIFVALYRSPSPNCPSNFFEILQDKIDDMMAKNCDSELVVLGDFNVHNTAWLIYSDPKRNDHFGVEAEELSDAHSLTQLVNQPTRVPDRAGDTPYLLDLYCTSIPALTKLTVYAGLGQSDHLLIRSSIQVQSQNVSPPPSRKVWHYEHADWNGLGQFFKHFPWETHCLYNNSVNHAAQAFTETVLHGMDRFIPSSCIIPKRVTWFSAKSKQAVAKKNRAFSIYKRTLLPEDWERYRLARNRCKSIIVRDKQRFNQKQADNFAQHPTGSREFWSMVKKVKSNFSSSSLPPLNVNGVSVTESSAKANILGGLFAKNSTIDDNNIDPPTPFDSDMRMPPIYFHKRKVLRELQALDARKSAGSDNIPPLVFKRYATQLAPILTQIFVLSYKQGIFPDIWKMAKVQPVPKKGDKADPSNYRPISILSVAAKVFERYVNDHLVEFLESNKILNEKQFGFREKKSTGDLLVDIAHSINKSLDSGGESIAVALDISKAFDKVWHRNLLTKLKSYGVHERMIIWIESYLFDRKLTVKIDGVSSDIFNINAGVPQGSVLAPTLFLVYINQLLSLTQNPVYSYADDSTLLASHIPTKKGDAASIAENRSHIASSINEDLARIHDWGQRNLVDFNATKTQLCHFSRIKRDNNEIITMNDVVLQSCDSVRILGVTLHEELRWNKHISDIAKGAASKLGFLYRCKRYFSSHQLALIYKAFIRPCIEYCSHVWGGASVTTLKKLDRVQKRAIRLIGDRSLTDDFDSLHHRRVVADLTIFYKIFNGQCTEEVRKIIAPKKYSRDTRLKRSAHDRTVEVDENIKANTNLFQADFFHRAARAWNRLPQAVFPPGVNTPLFKKNVNNHLKSLSRNSLESIYKSSY